MQCGVLERVYFVECGVYIVETGLPSVGCVECGVRGVCGMLGVKSGVQKMESGVLEYGV